MKICVNFRTIATRDIVFVSKQLTGDGITTEFTLDSQFKTGGVLVFINGILGKKGAGNTWQEGPGQNKITFTTAPAGGGQPDEILVFYAEL